MTQWQTDARVIAVRQAEDLRPSRTLSFGMVLVAMATALLCALMPLNAPSPVSLGSAFNPANTIVTLSAPASNRAVIKRQAQGDPLAPVAEQAVPLAVAVLGAPIPAQPDSFDLPGRSHGLSAAPIGAAYPRGPPRA